MSKLAAILFAVVTAAPAAAHDVTPTAAPPNGCCSEYASALWVKQTRRTVPDGITSWWDHEGEAA
jgi:hypothetical protein